MFKSPYLILFSVVVDNAYYANHTGTAGSDTSDFDWIPTPDTTQLMKRYGLVFRQTPTGCQVLTELRQQTDNRQTVRIPNGSQLLFVMRLRNRLLPTITNLPTNLTAQQPLFLFTNQNPRADNTVERDSLPVTKGAAVTTDDQLQNIDQRKAILAQLGELAEGPVFGVLQLVLDQTQSGKYRIVEPNKTLTADRPVFTIAFQNRKSRWRYDVQVGTSGVVIDELLVQHLPSFTRQDIDANQVRFVCDSAVDLLEKQPDPKPDVRLAYRATVSLGTGNPGIGIERVLPYPLPNNLRAETDPVTQLVTVYSDVLILI